MFPGYWPDGSSCHVRSCSTSPCWASPHRTLAPELRWACQIIAIIGNKSFLERFSCLSIACKEGRFQCQLLAITPDDRVQQSVKHAESNLRTTVRILHLFGRWRNTCSTVASLIISSQARTFMPGLQSLAILTKGHYLTKRGLCVEIIHYMQRWCEHILYRTTVILSIHWGLLTFIYSVFKRFNRLTGPQWPYGPGLHQSQTSSGNRGGPWYTKLDIQHVLHLLSEWMGKTPNEWPRIRNTTAPRYPAKNYGCKLTSIHLIIDKKGICPCWKSQNSLSWVRQVVGIPAFTKCLYSVPLNMVNWHRVTCCFFLKRASVVLERVNLHEFH